ncbi:MAG: hypothetical protein ACJ8GN_11050 [Longimicrobiaceae bacterium]
MSSPFHFDESSFSRPKAAEERPQCKPRPDKMRKLEFKPQKMVHWLDPGQLMHTIYRSQLASVFGVYADRREVQAALSHGAQEEEEKDRKRLDYSEAPGGEIWIDYVADVGEGFASTYTLAWLLARKDLPRPGVGEDRAVAADADAGDGERLPRGRILIMGGDEVYPIPGKDGYRNRMAGPYDAALPCLPDLTEECPNLYAIPGNHDWYDGLTSFLRQFCQGRSIGAWKTQQRRSYWALKLPNRWWLWGTDIQLGADIDFPQLEYFRDKAKNAAKEGDRVILCTAEPSWVHAGRKAGKRGASATPEVGRQEGFDNLEFFERHIIRENGLVLAATLTGDAHHYTRYSHVDASGRESVTKIIAGGGGAHLHPTHHLPDCLPLAFSPVKDGGEATTVRLTRRVEFPAQEESRRLLRGLWRLGGQNPGMANLLGGVYAGLFLCLFGAFLGWNGKNSILGPLSGMLLGNGVFLALLMFAALFAVANLFPAAAWWVRLAAGFLHWLAHVGLVVTAVWLLVKPDPALADSYAQDPVLLGLFGVAMVIVGRYLGMLLMGLYFWIAEKVGVNESEALAAQSIENYKNFLRLHFDRDGNLTIYPFGIHETVRKDDWIPAPKPPKGREGDSLLKPGPGCTPRIHLIEEPIVIPWSVQPPYPSAER